MKRNLLSLYLLIATIVFPLDHMSATIHLNYVPAKTRFSKFTDKDFTISGLITNEDGEAIFGAAIVIKGDEGKGTFSELDGSYTLKLPNAEQTLIIRYLGYQSLVLIQL